MIPPTLPHHVPLPIKNLIKQAKIGILATSSLDAYPHPVIIFYNYYPTEETIYFFISRTAKTVGRLSRNPNAAICIDQRDLRNPMRNFGVLLNGITNHITKKDVINSILEDFLSKKYQTLPKDPQQLKKNYKWLFPSHGKCFRFDITSMVWWRGPHFRRIRLRD